MADRDRDKSSSQHEGGSHSGKSSQGSPERDSQGQFTGGRQGEGHGSQGSKSSQGSKGSQGSQGSKGSSGSEKDEEE